ncbi:MAG: hypothetical protein R2867_20320 [Caldilineaceae bacterium]
MGLIGSGSYAFLGTLLGVGAHGTLRFISSLRHPHHEPQLKRVYMYQAYERFWHWLQTVTIILLLFTGLVIHRPDLLGIFAFRYMVARCTTCYRRARDQRRALSLLAPGRR